MSIRFTRSFIILIVSLLIYNPVFSQSKHELFGGIGILNLVTIGDRYQLVRDTIRLELSMGFTKGKTAASGDVLYHFGGFSSMSTRRPWYMRGGVTLISAKYQESSTDDPEFTIAPVLNIRLGREFNISGKAGFNLEAGIVYSPSTRELFDSKLFQGVGIFLFYKI